MASITDETLEIETLEIETDLDLDETEVETWDDWNSDDDAGAADYLCLFCTSTFASSSDVFNHCSEKHCFDFRAVVKDAALDFYGAMKLINFVRAQVAENKCWSCGVSFQCNDDLQSHLHAASSYEKEGKLLWEDDIYLRPFMTDDGLLHSFVSDDDEEDDTAVIDKGELMRELMDGEELGSLSEICNDTQSFFDIDDHDHHDLKGTRKGEGLVENGLGHSSNGITRDGLGGNGALYNKQKLKQHRVSFASVAAKEIENVNDNYFGAYGTFGIHREMLGDTVRMDAYGGAILKNPTLMKQAIVMDVGCGTGILSMFAAKAGASRVIAVEASVKMASVATQIVKDNGLLADSENDGKQHSGVINVVQAMVEEIDKVTPVLPHSVDVLVSEWMGYCLLYESMLTSVLYARDRWLKPGGAILPDTATIFVAGFGKGGTSLPFWEDVYGFNMSCIGKEVVEDATRLPIVDVIDSRDIMTESVTLQAFDLATMKPEEMDFTSLCELELKSDLLEVPTDAEPRVSWCHGLVLWFETGFTSRFCKEMPTVLSTSPYSKSTHWSQSIFTFQEPIAMSPAKSIPETDAVVGTEKCPAVRIRSRISIARSSIHRSIDISIETTGISLDGRNHSWPAQIFNL